MARRIAIGAAWWLAATYAFQFGAFMYGLPAGLAPLAALPLAIAIAATRPARRSRPADLRRIYQPKADSPTVGAEPSVVIGR